MALVVHNVTDSSLACLSLTKVSHSMRETSRSSRGILFGGIVILAIIAIGLWAVWQSVPRPAGSKAVALSREQRNEWEQKKNLAVGLLENGQYIEADEKFTEIVAAFPDEVLGLRNLTIARILAQEAGQADVEKVMQAADLLRQKDAGSAISRLIIANAAKLAGNLEAAVAEMKQAVESAPSDPAIAYELYQTARDSTDETTRKDARGALEKAGQLLPKNLFLVVERMLAHVETRDPEIVSLLQDAYPTFQWLAESIRIQNRVEIRDLVDRAVTAVKEDKWPVARNNVYILANMLRPQPATQSDRLRVQKHPLEYIVLDFSDQLGPARADPVADSSPPITVAFENVPFIVQSQPLSNVVAVELADIDLDGRVDLALLQEDQLRVLTQAKEPSSWESLCEPVRFKMVKGIIVTDLDQDLEERRRTNAGLESPPQADPICHDADPDFVVFGAGGVTLLRNDKDQASGHRSLQPVAQADRFAELRDVLAVVASDLDHDGDLDLAISTANGISLWSNRGDMTFVDISEKSQLPPVDLQATALVSVDWDRDLDFDVLCGSTTSPIGYLENTGHGRFRWQVVSDNPDQKTAARSLALLSGDPQMSWNLVVGGPSGTSLTSSKISPSGVVMLSKHTAVSDVPTDGLLKWDYDNDGILDVTCWNGDRIQLFRGVTGLTFQDKSALLSDNVRIGEIRDCKVSDYDNDGDLDLFVAGADGIRLLTNQGGNQNHWLNISLRAEQEKGGQVSASGRVNHCGVGSLLELRSGLNYQAQIVDGAVTHFGLGTRSADVVRVLWTNGVPANIIHPQSDLQICERQTLKGSCPYVYTWNGTAFEFWTDLLWAAPLGLQFAEGIYASPRSSEYLKISGEKLQQQDGFYPLQVTEELWEAAYFDQIKLLAVDHPADVEIFSNEKVGPAALAAFKVHTVRDRRVPVAARDQLNRDVLELVRHTDGKFLKAFDHKLRQGLTEEHYLELDLGPLKDPRQLTLFLTGWIYPTDTSINVALAQSDQLKGPRPPSLWVPAANGDWIESVPFMGFPGGKTKTIAVDLSHVFRTDDYRLRIVTTAEIYWDAAFFTVDEPVSDFNVIPLKLASAELHFRGFSARVPNDANGPETLDYSNVQQSPLWPPMEGRFTRYGDVTELLQDEDDRLVIVGSGDEISLKFAVPSEPVRPGYKRDFLMYNVGWDKDADLNTVYGQTVEPLPFGKMSGYPYRGDESYPETPLHQRDLRRYQTRRQPVAPFRKF